MLYITTKLRRFLRHFSCRLFIQRIVCIRFLHTHTHKQSKQRQYCRSSLRGTVWASQTRPSLMTTPASIHCAICWDTRDLRCRCLDDISIRTNQHTHTRFFEKRFATFGEQETYRRVAHRFWWFEGIVGRHCYCKVERGVFVKPFWWRDVTEYFFKFFFFLPKLYKFKHKYSFLFSNN